MNELKSYSPPKSARNNLPSKESDDTRFAIPLRLNTKDAELSFVSTVTVFGTPIDVTLSKLAIETFLDGKRRCGKPESIPTVRI